MYSMKIGCDVSISIYIIYSNIDSSKVRRSSKELYVYICRRFLISIRCTEYHRIYNSLDILCILEIFVILSSQILRSNCKTS